MPQRNIVLANNQIYHILNRGISGMPIFSTKQDNKRFIELLKFYRYSKTKISFSHFTKLPKKTKQETIKRIQKKETLRVEILAYCLMPTHFHLLLLQRQENGIGKMLSDIQNAYVRYFNLKRKRKGPLFESMFKAVRMETEEQLIHTSRYIHLNPATSFLVEPDKISSYEWSSLTSYEKRTKENSFINSKLIIKLVGSKQKYKKFVLDNADYQRKLNVVKHLTLEKT